MEVVPDRSAADEQRALRFTSDSLGLLASALFIRLLAYPLTRGPAVIALSGSGSYPFAAISGATVGGPTPGPQRRIETAVKLLGALEKPFYAAVNPLVQRLIRSGVRPNTITTVGTGLVLVSAVAYATGHVRLGGALLLLSGVADTLDGQVARSGAMVTRFGAFYDSTLDRVGDGATFIGIAAFLLTAPDVAYRVPATIICMIAILGSLLVSYARARAEGLGLDCKVGIAQRAERVLGLGIASLLAGAGPHALLLEAMVTLLAVASIITVVQRFAYVHQHAGQVDEAIQAEELRQAEAVQQAEQMRVMKHRALDPLAKGHSSG